jgi:hypothetical protein
MASLADIPDAFLDPTMIEPFIEWLIILPTSKNAKTKLLSIWADATGGTVSYDRFIRATTTGLIIDEH